MATHHLVVNRSSDVVDRELIALLRDLCVEDDLKQQIAKLVTQFAGPSLARVLDRFKRLVRFFEQHRRERGVRLLAVPGAAVWRTQPSHKCY